MESGSFFVSRYEDVVAVYRDARASSDKKVEFKPKFGDSPLYEHHTTSLVFNDPPLHTRVRGLIMGALNQRAIARMEAGVFSLVDRLLDAFTEKTDLIEAFAARIPVEVIGNLLDIPRDERGPLRAWSLAILTGLEPRLDAGDARARQPRGGRVQGLSRATRRRARRKSPGDPETDVLTRLIQGETDGDRRRAALPQLHLSPERGARDHHQSHRQRHLALAHA